ncbi:MAG: hypothetical protein JJT89_08365 [Nitriliruptoraceae bacterium]|nr:hypothetical protein [Nitriliruptoraceae bacterium]
MGRLFEELSSRVTPIGELSLRRRLDPRLGVDVYEVKLGEEYLMSSLFTRAEEELARLGIAACPTPQLRVVVGGLGLGYTAAASLEHDRVRSVRVVDALEDVIDWHQRDLLPATRGLAADERLRLVHADFFALAAGRDGGLGDGGTVDVVLLDIDHTPSHLLDAAHAPFYAPSGLRAMAAQLAPDGVFALWSDTPPDGSFLDHLRAVFDRVVSHEVRFDNPFTGGVSANTVVVASGVRGEPGG